MRIIIKIFEKKKGLLKDFAEFWYYVAKNPEYKYWFFDSKWDEWGISRLNEKNLEKMRENYKKSLEEWKELMNNVPKERD